MKIKRLKHICCRDVRLEGFSTEYERMWSVHPTNSEQIVIRNLTIQSAGGNGDPLTRSSEAARA